MKRDVIEARPLLRAVAAALKLPTWELVVCVDFTYTGTALSVQHITHLDNPKHPFAKGRKVINEARLTQNCGRLTAVLTKYAVGNERLVFRPYLVHHILGHDVRAAEPILYEYNPPFQVLLLSQPEDPQTTNVGEALRALRGSGRPMSSRAMKTTALPTNGVVI